MDDEDKTDAKLARGRGGPGRKKKSYNGRKALPRLDVLALLRQHDYNPVVELINIARDPATSPKIASDIAQELLTYVSPRCKTVLEVETNSNPLLEVMSLIALQGRPRPPSESDLIAEAKPIGALAPPSGD